VVIALSVERDLLCFVLPEVVYCGTQQQRADAMALVSRMHGYAVEMGHWQAEFPTSIPHYFARHFCHGEV